MNAVFGNKPSLRGIQEVDGAGSVGKTDEIPLASTVGSERTGAPLLVAFRQDAHGHSMGRGGELDIVNAKRALILVEEESQFPFG
jgi:hypothetical protein